MNRIVLSAVLALALTPLAAEARPHGAVAVGSHASQRGPSYGPQHVAPPRYAAPVRYGPRYGPRYAPGPRFVPGPHFYPRYVPPRVVVRPTYVMPVRPLWRPHLFGVHVVHALPFGAVALTIGTTPYWYAGGEYYAQIAGGYQLIAPPVGAWLAQLPAGAQTYVTGGITFATVNGSYFQWYPDYGAWLVVAPPAY